jgi:hypothetical protein
VASGSEARDAPTTHEVRKRQAFAALLALTPRPTYGSSEDRPAAAVWQVMYCMTPDGGSRSVLPGFDRLGLTPVDGRTLPVPQRLTT